MDDIRYGTCSTSYCLPVLFGGKIYVTQNQKQSVSNWEYQHRLVFFSFLLFYIFHCQLHCMYRFERSQMFAQRNNFVRQTIFQNIYEKKAPAICVRCLVRNVMVFFAGLGRAVVEILSFILLLSWNNDYLVLILCRLSCFGAFAICTLR